MVSTIKPYRISTSFGMNWSAAGYISSHVTTIAVSAFASYLNWYLISFSARWTTPPSFISRYHTVPPLRRSLRTRSGAMTAGPAGNFSLWNRLDSSSKPIAPLLVIYQLRSLYWKSTNFSFKILSIFWEIHLKIISIVPNVTYYRLLISAIPTSQFVFVLEIEVSYHGALTGQLTRISKMKMNY